MDNTRKTWKSFKDCIFAHGYDLTYHNGLYKANFQGVELYEANLQCASLIEVSFQEADLAIANLQEAKLWDVNFEKANLQDANLQDAALKRVNFKEARLWGANLQKSDLRGAIDLTVEQLSKAKTLFGAKLNPELEEPLREKYPHLFEKPKE